jgi:hypothetical protein
MTPGSRRGPDTHSVLPVVNIGVCVAATQDDVLVLACFLIEHPFSASDITPMNAAEKRSLARGKVFSVAP